MEESAYSQSEELNCNQLGVDLIRAIEELNFDDAQKLINDGANVNVHSINFAARYAKTPLFALCDNDYLGDEEKAFKILLCLIDHGAIIDEQNHYGVTPLMAAVCNHNKKISIYLIENGADINIRDISGRNCLTFYAIDNDLDKELFELLLKKGGNIKDCDNRGRTCLMEAAAHGTINLVKFLLEKGADIEDRDKNDQNILDYALGKENTEVVEFLQSKLTPSNYPPHKKRKTETREINTDIQLMPLRDTNNLSITQPSQLHINASLALAELLMADDYTSKIKNYEFLVDLAGDPLLSHDFLPFFESLNGLTNVACIEFMRQQMLKFAQEDSVKTEQTSMSIVPDGFMPRIRLKNPSTNDTGSRCFINVVFQCLLHLQRVAQLLVNSNDYYTKNSLADLYLNILKKLPNHNDMLIDLTEFSKKVWQSLNMPIGTQQDAAEFLNHLLDRLLDEDISVERKQNFNYYESTKIPHNDLSQLLYFTIKSKISAKECEPSIVKEFYTMLNLPIGDFCTSLEDCIKLYFSKELLEQTNPDEPIKEKQLSLSQPAPYMIMRLKRDIFSLNPSSDGTRYMQTKNNATISFPLKLSFLHTETDSEEETESHYKLLSCIVHYGTADAGHYTAFININEEWYYFDDEQMPKLLSYETISQIAQQGYFIDKQITPVIFFYCKC